MLKEAGDSAQHGQQAGRPMAGMRIYSDYIGGKN
jgi:hypothetical protein